ncbi:MAG: RNA methyltransferase [Acidobacteria bacterium]|nr:RNA methyltransferase [Acidobacteriota bacterium]
MRRKTVKKIEIQPTLSTEQREFLESFLSAKRINTLHRILNFRLGDITVVLDNLFDPHNMGAIVRTAEALGIQDIHAVEKDTELDLSAKITKYSDKWVSIHTHKDSKECVSSLQKDGFTIVAAQMTRQAIPAEQYEITADTKTALVLGNEHAGTSEEMCSMADVHVVIPMYGFTESFNVSVAAALLLGDFVRKKRGAIRPETGTLDENRKSVLYSQWLQKAVKKSDRLLRAFENRHG